MDKIISWLRTHREIVLYVIFGALTTLVSLGIYFLCVNLFLDPADPLQLGLANVLSWVGAVTFAFVTNRRYVFQSKSNQPLREAVSFFLSRVGTLLIDVACMHVLVFWLHLRDDVAKGIVQVIVLVGNYLLSRFVVFRGEKEKEKK